MDRPVEGNGGIIGDSNTSISDARIENTTEGADDNRDRIRGPINKSILTYLWNTNPVNLDYSGHMNQLA